MVPCINFSAALYGVQGQALSKETQVRCYSGDQCPPGDVINSDFMLTLSQCCLERAGLTYEVDGIKGCFECVGKCKAACHQ